MTSENLENCEDNLKSLIRELQDSTPQLQWMSSGRFQVKIPLTKTFGSSYVATYGQNLQPKRY